MLGSSRLDSSDIISAGNYLERAFLRQLPKVYEQKYPKLWLSANSEIVPVTGNLGDYSEEIEEVSLSFGGLAAELVDKSSDIPIISHSIETRKFKIHVYSIATEKSILEIAARQASRKDINTRELFAINKALMQAVHNLGVFGQPGRGSYGLYNDPNVPVTVTGYNPATASWQDHVDFFTERLTEIEDRNELTEGIKYIIIPNKLKGILSSTYQSGDTGKTPMEAIMDSFGVGSSSVSGGTLEGFIVHNENKAPLLEKFGVKPVGTNEDRIVFVPANPDVASRLMDAPNKLPTQTERINFIDIFYVSASQTMIHYPEAMEYSDIPTLSV